MAPIPLGLHPKTCGNGPSGKPLRLFGSSFPAALPCVGRFSVAHWSLTNWGTDTSANTCVASTKTAAKPWILRESDRSENGKRPRVTVDRQKKIGKRKSGWANQITSTSSAKRQTHGREMPVDVAVEKPGTGIVSDKAQCGRLHRQQLYCVTADRVQLSLLELRVECWVTGSVVLAAVDNLELVAVDVAMQ